MMMHGSRSLSHATPKISSGFNFLSATAGCHSDQPIQIVALPPTSNPRRRIFDLTFLTSRQSPKPFILSIRSNSISATKHGKQGCKFSCCHALVLGSDMYCVGFIRMRNMIIVLLQPTFNCSLQLSIQLLITNSILLDDSHH